MSTFSSQSRRSGFSLIEVAIALAIFVFGALAIVRIFPPALGVIRNNESRATATHLGDTMLARSTGKLGSVPDAIYEGDSLGVWSEAVTTNASPKSIAMIGTPSKNNSLPNSPLPADFVNSALNHFKYISGEKYIVNSDGSVLTNFPIAAPVDVWTDDVIEDVQINEAGKLNFQYAKLASNGNSVLDTSPAVLGEYPPLDTMRVDNNYKYYVSYSWVEGTPKKLHSVIDEPLVIPTDTNWLAFPSNRVLQGIRLNLTPDPNDRVIPGAVTIRITNKLLTIPFITNNAKRGYISGLTAGQKVSLHYLSDDYRWLVNDSSPTSLPENINEYLTPNAPLFYKPRSVFLPVKDVDENQAQYFLLQSGLKGAIDLDPVVSPKKKDNRLLYKSGEFVFDLDKDNDNINVLAPRSRIVYQALDGWAQQLSVAAKSYVPFYDLASLGGTRGTFPREEWREYYWGSGNNLYFRASEAGKSVVVSYFDGATNKVVSGVVLTINDNLEVSPNTFSSAEVSKAIITDLSGDPALNVEAILSIQGLSIQARTAWQNGDRYEQVLVPGYRTLMP